MGTIEPYEGKWGESRILLEAIEYFSAITTRGHAGSNGYARAKRCLTKVATLKYNVAMIAAGIKDLKNRLSYYLREVKRGEKIMITERDQVIATILPVERGEEDAKLLSLVREGFAAWKGGKPAGSSRPIGIRGKAVSEIVLEDRR